MSVGRAVTRRDAGSTAHRPGAVASDVYQYLDRDVAAREMLARGVMSLRAMARWLIQDQSWQHATEEAVVSALRRYPAKGRTTSTRGAEALLRKSHVNTRGNVCSLVVPKTADAHRKLSRIIELIDPSRGELVRVIEGERVITVLVDRARLDAVRRVLAGPGTRLVILDLVEYSIVSPPEARDTPGVLALVFATLAAHGINIVESLGGTSEHLFFVHERDSRRTFHVLTKLMASRRTDFT